MVCIENLPWFCFQLYIWFSTSAKKCLISIRIYSKSPITHRIIHEILNLYLWNTRSVFVFHIVLHTLPSFARISIKTLLAPPPDYGDDDDGDGDDGDGDDGDDDDFNYCSSHHEVDGMFAEVLGDVREDRHLKDEFMTMRKGQPGALIREKHGIFPNYVPSPFQNMLFSSQGFFCLKFLIKNYPFIPTNTVMVAILSLWLQWFTNDDDWQLPQY